MATPPYATLDDLEARLGHELDEAETTRAGSLLDTVSAYVDLNLPTCVDTILEDFPTLLVDVVCSATLRALATTPNRDPHQTQVQVGEAQVSYRYERPTGSTGGHLNDDEIATLRKACGEGTASGLGSVSITTSLYDMALAEPPAPYDGFPSDLIDEWAAARILAWSGGRAIGSVVDACLVCRLLRPASG